MKKEIKYVMKMDEDKRMKKEDVKNMEGKMKKKMKRNVIDEKKGKVVRGYGIIKKRVKK